MNFEEFKLEEERSFMDDPKHSHEYLNHFKKLPEANVIGKEAFEQRTAEVFHTLWETLSRSFGPYGANTTIMNYPFTHVTKDGFTIMKNLSMNTADTLIDQSIANLASDICGRLNYSVGDGTTTAVIATNGIYQRYMEARETLNKSMMLPRDVSEFYRALISEISKRVTKKARPIQSDDPGKLYQNIYDVVFISSNADTKISGYIAGFYKELHCPAITAELSPDGVTRANLISGYQIKAMLSDRLYINSDNDRMNLQEADIIIFTIKINKSIYEEILKPINQASKERGRHLICFAPQYDSVLIDTTIRNELNEEYRKNKEINLVLMSYSAFGTYNRHIIEDFATLCNTVTIDQPRCTEIFRDLENGKTVSEIINMDYRLEIPNLKIGVMTTDKNGNAINAVRITTDEYNALVHKENSHPIFGPDNNKYRLGYARDISLGMKQSVFHEFFYDEARYNVALQDAKRDLEEMEEKYKNLGTYNTDVSNAQSRYYSLGLKMGLIQVGGEGELSRKCLKDSVDDAVRAAASAYDHGVIYGCNTTLIATIFEMYNEEMCTEEPDENKLLLLNILLEGFLDVYRTLLANAFPDETIYDITSDATLSSPKEVMTLVTEFLDHRFTTDNNPFDYEDEYFACALDKIFNRYGSINYHDLIIYYGIEKHAVFDISKKQYSRKVINSAQTDLEVLKATVDLITLLIVSNQMLVTQKRNFDTTI